MGKKSQSKRLEPEAYPEQKTSDYKSSFAILDEEDTLDTKTVFRDLRDPEEIRRQKIIQTTVISVISVVLVLGLLYLLVLRTTILASDEYKFDVFVNDIGHAIANTDGLSDEEGIQKLDSLVAWPITASSYTEWIQSTVSNPPLVFDGYQDMERTVGIARYVKMNFTDSKGSPISYVLLISGYGGKWISATPLMPYNEEMFQPLDPSTLNLPDLSHPSLAPTPTPKETTLRIPEPDKALG